MNTVHFHPLVNGCTHYSAYGSIHSGRIPATGQNRQFLQTAYLLRVSARFLEYTLSAGDRFGNGGNVKGNRATYFCCW